MNQPLGRVILDAARAVLASARLLAREDFMADKFHGLLLWKDDGGFMLWHSQALISSDRRSDVCTHGQIQQYMYWFQGSLMT